MRIDGIDPDDLVAALTGALSPWLVTRRWSGSGGEPPRVVVPRRLDVLRRQWPLLLWCPTEVVHHDGSRATYQLVLGVRPGGDRSAVEGLDPDAVIGVVPGPDGPATVYDALADPVLCIELGNQIMPGVDLARPSVMAGDFTNSSIVFEQRWILKVFRRLEDGPNPDIEMTEALARQGCEEVAAPVAVWRRGDADLGVIRRFEPRVVDGFELATASVRELLRRRVQPRETTADFGPEAATLGRAVARVHVASAAAFGTEPADGDRLAAELTDHLSSVAPPGIDLGSVAAAYERLAGTVSLGQVIRVHGDLHLSQVLRRRRGWMLIDFEGEPVRPLHDRRQMSSPIRDIAGMIRSFGYVVGLVSAEIRAEEGVDEDEPELGLLADAWEARAVDAFLTGYTSIDGVHRLLPADRRSRDALLSVFELDKAVYEVAYEVAHRPELAPIPTSAVERLLHGEQTQRW